MQSGPIQIIIGSMKLFLCSAGFDNERLIPHFTALLGKPGSECRALLITTALRTAKAREYLPLFVEDLNRVGVTEENTVRTELDGPLEEPLLESVDLVFACPGDPEYLLERMRATGFHDRLKSLLTDGMPYIGVSAGADVLAANYPDGLNLIPQCIECHAGKGSRSGPVGDSTRTVFLADDQALVVDGNRMEVVS